MVPLTIGLFALAAALPSTARAEDPEVPDVQVVGPCHEFNAFPEVSYEAADELVPEGFTVLPSPFDPTGEQASLQITARLCEALTFSGKTEHDVVESYIAVPIETPPGAPRDGAVGPVDAELISLGPLNTYLVQWVTTSQRRATWLKQRTGLGDLQVRIIDGLVFDYDPVPGFVPGAVDLDFRVDVPEPAPSPYTITATLTEPGGVPWEALQNHWWQTDKGIGLIYADAPQFFLGTATNGMITSNDPTSPLGRTFGEQQERPTGPPVDGGNPAFYEEGGWTKFLCTEANPMACSGQV